MPDLPPRINLITPLRRKSSPLTPLLPRRTERCLSNPDGYLWEVAFGTLGFNDDDSLKIT